jgi:hypothetical protein
MIVFRETGLVDVSGNILTDSQFLSSVKVIVPLQQSEQTLILMPCLIELILDWVKTAIIREFWKISILFIYMYKSTFPDYSQGFYYLKQKNGSSKTASVFFPFCFYHLDNC